MEYIYNLIMGQQQSVQKVNFEDVQFIINSSRNNYILINTLSNHNQNCLITNTITVDKEEQIINGCLSNPNVRIVIYGKNTNDPKIIEKYKQLLNLGFMNIYIYPGGLFEWLCLQDIFGKDEFPTTIDELDIYKYRPKSKFNELLLLENID
jgi:hypothetical protein